MSLRLATWLSPSFLDWDGNVCAVLFTPGCNFRCPFCHNHEIVSYRGEGVALESILDELERYRDWLDGIVITGGEPTIHGELPMALEEIKRRGWRVKLDTNGYNPNMLRVLLENKLVDYVAMDIKTSPSKYDKAAGIQVNMDSILDSVNLLLRLGENAEFRTTVVPLLVDEKDVKEIRKLIGSKAKYILQGFVPEVAHSPFFRTLKPYKACEVRDWDKEAVLRGFRE